jgi:hypothetical protein
MNYPKEVYEAFADIMQFCVYTTGSSPKILEILNGLLVHEPPRRIMRNVWPYSQPTQQGTQAAKEKDAASGHC